MGNQNSQIDKKLLTPRNGKLFKKCSWDQKMVRKLILQKKLAPFVSGTENVPKDLGEECIICMLYFSCGLNRCTKCNNGYCTECFLQVCGPTSNCPMCLCSPFRAHYTGPKALKDLACENQEQAKASELRMGAVDKDELEQTRKLKDRADTLAKEPVKAAPPTPITQLQRARARGSLINLENAMLREALRRSRSEYTQSLSTELSTSQSSTNRTFSEVEVQNLSEEDQLKFAIAMSVSASSSQFPEASDDIAQSAAIDSTV